MSHSPIVKISLHDIHQMSHLSKNEHSVIEPFEFGQYPINKFKFS